MILRYGIWGARMAAMAVTTIFLIACNSPAPTQQTATPETVTPTSTLTTTPTELYGGSVDSTPSPEPGMCDGLSGELEMQILVGPAEVVGLEPTAVGSLPFTTKLTGETYQVEGGGAIAYQQTLEEEWGTYTVMLDMDTVLSGECTGAPGSEALLINVQASGEQLVEVRSEGFQGDYPWSGTKVMALRFPLQDGARAEGEGWVFVLHLAQ